MNEIIILFLSLAITISILHLFTSVIIMTKKTRTEVGIDENTLEESLPLISIFKPLKGIDDQLENNLRSFFELDYPNFEILFGVDSYRDPAVNVVERLRKEYKSVGSKLIASRFTIGLNP